MGLSLGLAAGGIRQLVLEAEAGASDLVCAHSGLKSHHHSTGEPLQEIGPPYKDENQLIAWLSSK